MECQRRGTWRCCRGSISLLMYILDPKAGPIRHGVENKHKHTHGALILESWRRAAPPPPWLWACIGCCAASGLRQVDRHMSRRTNSNAIVHKWHISPQTMCHITI